MSVLETDPVTRGVGVPRYMNGAVAHVVVGRPAVVSTQRMFVAKPFASRSAEATTREKMPPIG